MMPTAFSTAARLASGVLTSDEQRRQLAPGLLGLRGHRLEVLLVPVDGDHAGPLRRQRDGAGTAQPAGSDHEGRPSGEPQPVRHQCTSPVIPPRILVW